jgi:hypothetical protein
MTILTSAENFSHDGLQQLEMRLRRARLGLGVGVLGIVMVFVSFTSAYIVRQGLPTLDPRTNTSRALDYTDACRFHSQCFRRS